jgi:hypothetical protein
MAMQEAKELIARYRKGELTFEDLLVREWEKEIQQEGPIAVRLKKKQINQLKAKTLIYYRVRKRLQGQELIPPRPEKGWRAKLKL